MIKIVEKNGVMIYQQSAKPKKSRLESSHQTDLVSLIRAHYPEHAALLFHAANEGSNKVQYRAKQATQGVLKGVSDIICLHGGALCSVFVCELKRGNSAPSSISKEQAEFIRLSSSQGHYAVAAFGAYAGWHAWLDYLGIGESENIRSKANHLIEI